MNDLTAVNESLTTNSHLSGPGLTASELKFIATHRHEDINQLILRSGQFKDLNVKKLAAQILARQKAAKKLPFWSSFDQIIFPPALSVEQCSSEATANYKASLVQGESLIDITGGMGIDCYYLSARFDHVSYFEQQEEVATTTAFNYKILGVKNIHVHCENSITALSEKHLTSTWLYADPARRDAGNRKVVRLSDCTPDILNNLPLLLRTAQHVLLKTSPLLDIDLAVQELKYVQEVHVIGYEQECKELLFILNSQSDGPCKINAMIIDAAGEILHSVSITRKSEQNSEISYSEPLSYLYEPHPAILKAGAFKSIAALYGIHKLAPHSHLYTSEKLVTGFPGRTFEIAGVCKPDMKEISAFTKDGKANLTIRNFPAKTEDLRKKWRLKDGGDIYLFATTQLDSKKIVIVTKKITDQTTASLS